jgi:hypothetical protein
MNKKIFIAIGLFALSSAAFAGAHSDGHGGYVDDYGQKCDSQGHVIQTGHSGEQSSSSTVTGTNTNTNTNSNSNTNTNTNKSNSTSNATGGNSTSNSTGGSVSNSGNSTANATGGAGGNATGGSGGTSNSSAYTNTGGNTQTSVYEQVRQAPSVSQGSFAISGCSVAGNAGGSNTHGSVFLGFGWTPDECYLFMQAQAYQSVGQSQSACEVLNHTKAAKRLVKEGMKLPNCAPLVVPAGSPTVLNIIQQKETNSVDVVTHKELSEIEKRIVTSITSK